jgi:FtsP/CotA-like multicopper oxidase with cupredoxin domain
MDIPRRALLKWSGFGSSVATALVSGRRLSGQTAPPGSTGTSHSHHVMGPVGRVSSGWFDPGVFLRTWNFSHLPPDERSRHYRETRRPDGSYLREYEIAAVDREIEIAPGVFFPAWTYNGQVPGPTLRATEGDRVRVTFINQGSHPHSIHFHGWHAPEMDGSFPEQQVKPGDRFVYEFDADPFGLHLYHCHTMPLAKHIAKGLYGTFVVDPKQPRPKVDHEFVMVQHGWDVDFNGENEFYAVNGPVFFYQNNPIKLKVNQKVRVYLVNILEFDQINSFHVHANFFHYFPTGTMLTPTEYTDTIVQAQGQRGILELKFPYTGKYMFHAHKTEFAELGWMGFFEVKD